MLAQMPRRGHQGKAVICWSSTGFRWNACIWCKQASGRRAAKPAAEREAGAQQAAAVPGGNQAGSGNSLAGHWLQLGVAESKAE